ncbi:hypothetical protein [Microbacterium sp. CPCC 204701]|uniref:hypothetical protein n=1 Tax=Microbacterium sp. CPCC 204701 TaxID=2493084 RepID=UPI000FDBCDEF|nr:hypothetical protein [Microbacterium sp. CPCC 204701]
MTTTGVGESTAPDALLPSDASSDAQAGFDDPLEAAENRDMRNGLVRTLLAVLANVGVLTALLVYFGWVRADRMATLVGLDEAILGMTVDDYVRRSVRSVFLLPIFAAVAGLLWVGLDQWWQRRRVRCGIDDPAVGFVARWLWGAATLVFVAGLAMWLAGYALSFTLGPLVCVAGLLLFLYALSLRSRLPGAVGFAPLTEGVLRGSIALLAAVGLFWSATNFATVEGTELARDFEAHVATRPGVEVDSAVPLDIVAPGVETSCFGTGDDRRYHYRGLRLLESTGGNYFLTSEDWSPEYGVVVMLPTDAEGTRFTFVRDVEGVRAEAYPPCDADEPAGAGPAG